MLRQHQASLDDRKKFTALVKDLFPDQAKNVNLLLMAYNMGIAQDIQSASHINNTFAFRYVKQLMDDFGMSRVNADWIVSVWCSCYGGKVLGKACDISSQKQGSGPAMQGEQSSYGRSYGDLFTYEKSCRGKGLAVTGKHHIAHDYFNLTDELMNQDHKADSSLPECKSKKANYYVQRGCSFQMRHRFMAYIDRLIEHNERIYEFRAECRLNKVAIEKEVADHIVQKLYEQGRSSIRIKTCSNRKLGIYRIEIS